MPKKTFSITLATVWTVKMLMLFVLFIVILNIYVYQQIVSVGIHKCLVKEKVVKILQLCVHFLANS